MTAAEAKNAKKITKKQKAVLDFIAQTIEETGIAPTVRDICVGLGLSSPPRCMYI
ncbi:MAG: LexA family protein [Eggerthellaceae bacterium]